MKKLVFLLLAVMMVVSLTSASAWDDMISADSYSSSGQYDSAYSMSGNIYGTILVQVWYGFTTTPSYGWAKATVDGYQYVTVSGSESYESDYDFFTGTEDVICESYVTSGSPGAYATANAYWPWF
ncbi:hypothetical protein ACFL6P_01680 [Candidatus Latescibacterota bacterium]